MRIRSPNSLAICSRLTRTESTNPRGIWSQRQSPCCPWHLGGETAISRVGIRRSDELKKEGTNNERIHSAGILMLRMLSPSLTIRVCWERLVFAIKTSLEIVQDMFETML